ncbi:glycosyltransferase family 2 protein [Rhodococcus daqingensis]|uniref:Glycosyltransferase family 2 protein n=1 Tax=Rhodococcus daqingensis TaxID=2479363 RepID=A0ABW2RZ43_9NOCA
MVARIRPVTSPTRPSVSVVIPCYEYGHFLPDAVESALSQTGVDVDVLIIDNASSDNSPEVAKSLAASDSQVKCILRESNQGHIASFNEGLSRASGDYVVLLCADDMLAPGSLRRSTALLDARPEVAFAYGHAPSFVGRVPAARTEVRSWSVWSGPEWIDHICHQGHSVVTSPEVVMRGSVMSGLRYDTTNGHAADLKLWLDAARCGSVGRVNGPDQAYYRVHGANLHLNEYGGWLIDLRARARAFEAFSEELGNEQEIEPFEGVERGAGMARMRETWRRALAEEALDEACRSYDRGRVVPSDVRDLEEFAISTYPAARQLPQWRGLARRKAVGERLSRFVPIFFVSAIRRRLGEEVAHRRWVRTGLYESG